MKTIEELIIESGATPSKFNGCLALPTAWEFRLPQLTAFAEAYHAQKEADKVKLKGKIIEIGNLEDGIGRGIRLESNGEFIELVGMTEDECREAVKWFTQEVEITIALPPLPIAKDGE